MSAIISQIRAKVTGAGRAVHLRSHAVNDGGHPSLRPPVPRVDDSCNWS